MMDHCSCDATGTRSEPLIEDYLDRIWAPLVPMTSFECRTDAREEMRAHLLSLAAAWEELGTPRDEAVRAALQAFGDPTVLSRRWMLEIESSGSMPPELADQRSRQVAMRSFGSATLIGGLLLLATGDRINYSIYAWLLAALVLWLPTLAGGVVGVLAPRRPVRFSLQAMARLAAPTALIYLAWGQMQHFTFPWRAAALFGAMHAMGWIVCGVVSASVFGWMRRLALRMRSRLALR